MKIDTSIAPLNKTHTIGVSISDTISAKFSYPHTIHVLLVIHMLTDSKIFFGVGLCQFFQFLRVITPLLGKWWAWDISYSSNSDSPRIGLQCTSLYQEIDNLNKVKPAFTLKIISYPQEGLKLVLEKNFSGEFYHVYEKEQLFA